MPEAVTLLQLFLVTLFAATVQGAAGFAFGLIAMPAFMWILRSPDAVPLVIIMNLVISAVLAVRIHASVNGALLVRLASGALLGVPAGLAVFRWADLDQLLLAVSLVIFGFVGFVALRAEHAAGSEEDPDAGVAAPLGIGALGGGLTMALGMPGPPVILYMTGIRVPKDALRATALAFFVVSYSAALALQVVTVGVGSRVWISAGILLPVACAGGLLGNRLSGYVGEAAFRRAVLVLLVLIGVSTVVGVLSS